MSETRFHGARVTESTDLVTAINDVDSSVIGIVATADDADAELFPLNKPTLLTRVNDVLGKCGTTGTLYRALKAIADQVSTKVIVVRVAEHKEEDGKTQDQLVIGGSESDGSYTGMYALLVAEQDESIGYRPRILAAPELDTEAVTKSLCVIAGKLRAFVYASCHGCNTMAEAITYRQKFNEREVMLLWPDFIAYNPKSGKNETFPAPAYACGLRAYIDHEQGWHKSLSNVPVKNVLGMTPANVKDVISAIRAKLDSLVTAGKLIGAECWYDIVDTSASAFAYLPACATVLSMLREVSVTSFITRSLASVLMCSSHPTLTS